MSRKEDLVFSFTSELHDDVTKLYEAIVEEDDNKVSSNIIDELRRKLKALKDNLTNKDEV